MEKSSSLRKTNFNAETVEDLLRAEKFSLFGIIIQLAFALMLVISAVFDYSFAEIFFCNFQPNPDDSCPPFNLVGTLLFFACFIACPFHVYGFLCTIVSWVHLKLPKFGRTAPYVYVAFIFTLGVHLYSLYLAALGSFYCFTGPDHHGCFWTLVTVFMLSSCIASLLVTARKHYRVHRKMMELKLRSENCSVI